MKAKRSKKNVALQEDIGSPASVERFRSVAAVFTVRASASRKAAIAMLRREGIVTPKGNLTKRYSAK